MLAGSAATCTAREHVRRPSGQLVAANNAGSVLRPRGRHTHYRRRSYATVTTCGLTSAEAGAVRCASGFSAALPRSLAGALGRNQHW
jgi:hypothetical protein